MRFTYLVVSVNLVILFSDLNAYAPNNLCSKLLKYPNFDMDLIVGRPWRIYYSWVMETGRCMEMTFQKLNRTSEIKKKFASSMGKYLQDDVVWEDATMLLSKSPVIFREDEVTKEMLLFPKGHKGSFDVVHRFVDHYNGFLQKRSVPLGRYVLKLFRKSKYLVMANCMTGISFLMARPNETVHRLEVLTLASEIWDEFGYISCSSSHKFNKGIQGLLIDDNKIM